MIDPTTTGAIRAWLATGEPIELRIKSDSMWPLIRAGDLVVVRRRAKRKIRPGDIVLFERDETFVVHRVVRTGADLVTKGDAIAQKDSPVSADAVIGTVSGVKRGSTLIRLRGGMTGRLVGLLLPALARTWNRSRAQF